MHFPLFGMKNKQHLALAFLSMSHSASIEQHGILGAAYCPSTSAVGMGQNYVRLLHVQGASLVEDRSITGCAVATNM